MVDKIISKMMEPRLVIFCDEESAIEQMFICANTS